MLLRFIIDIYLTSECYLQTESRRNSALFGVKLYNVNLTARFQGVFPDTIQIAAREHAAAVRHYKRALRARAVTRGARIELLSEYGFRFHVNSTSNAEPATVRLALPPRVNRATVARALASSNAVTHRREGLVTTDRFGVTWMLA